MHDQGAHSNAAVFTALDKRGLKNVTGAYGCAFPRPMLPLFLLLRRTLDGTADGGSGGP